MNHSRLLARLGSDLHDGQHDAIDGSINMNLICLGTKMKRLRELVELKVFKLKVFLDINSHWWCYVREDTEHSGKNRKPLGKWKIDRI